MCRIWDTGTTRIRDNSTTVSGIPVRPIRIWDTGTSRTYLGYRSDPYVLGRLVSAERIWDTGLTRGRIWDIALMHM
jgi:hypothetical protein